MHFLPDVLRTAMAFAVVLGVLVFFHELGHYLAARLCGVHVEAFSIGFGRPVAAWRDRQGTQWKLGWLPLGGYVKMHGQERPEDVDPAVRDAWLPGRTFHEKGVGARAFVVAAGPLANFVLAVVVFSALFAAVGRPVMQPVVESVIQGSAAASAGLQAGDRIAAIDGQRIATFEDLQRVIGTHPGDRLTLQVQRGQATRELPVTVGAQEEGGGRVGVLGIRGGKETFTKVSPAGAIAGGFSQTWEVIRQTALGLWQMVAHHTGADNLGGPLRIAQLSGQVAELGVASLVSFIAVLSVNLGLLNLFPIPILDGGHLLFYLVEALRGRPVPPRAQEYGYRAGLALLAGLFVFATWNDLTHFGLFRWVAGLIG